MKKKWTSRVEAWSSGVEDGSIPSCRMVKLAVGRWRHDQARTDLVFDKLAFYTFVQFCHKLRQFKGEFAGKPLDLEDWQLFIAANIFGWKYKETGLRRFQYADVYVPRKNGKSSFAAAIALYMLLFDGEPAAEVYAAAVDKEQARICFDTAKSLIRGSELADMVDIYRGSIADMEEGSSFKPLTKDTKNKDGLNPHCAVCDERHAWQTNEIYDVLRTGMGARSQPLIFSISTAGTDTSVPYFTELDYMRKILEGQVEQDNRFVLLYEPDDGDKWDDEETWKKVNPNLSISLSLKYMKDLCEEAKAKGGSTLAAFQTKNLNMWVDAPDVWIPDDDVTRNIHNVDDDELIGSRCYVGIDLAAKTDICAIAFWFPDQKAVRWLYVIPEAKLQDSRMGDRVDYRAWREQGWLVTSPGKVIDEEWLIELLMSRFSKYDIQAIAYDPWGMWQILGKFGPYDDRLVEWSQNIRFMSVPTKWIESEVLNHRLDFGGNPITRWMFGNVVVYRDPNDNIKLDKKRSRNKIDGVVALADAAGAWLNSETKPKEEPKIYADHSLRYITDINQW